MLHLYASTQYMNLCTCFFSTHSASCSRPVPDQLCSSTLNHLTLQRFLKSLISLLSTSLRCLTVLADGPSEAEEPNSAALSADEEDSANPDKSKASSSWANVACAESEKPGEKPGISQSSKWDSEPGLDECGSAQSGSSYEHARKLSAESAAFR